MSAVQFAVGDVVVLRSGGPRMTVIAVGTGSNPSHKCVWFDGQAKKHTDLFPAVILVPAPSGS